MTGPHREIHPLTTYIPERADQDALVMDIALSGLHEPVILYEGKIIEGRVRYRAALEFGTEPQFKDWVLIADGDPLDWMVRRHVETHELSDLDKIRLVAAVLPAYKGMSGQTHKRLYEAIKLPWNKIRTVDWLLAAGALGPVLAGEKDLSQAGREAGLVSEKRGVALGTNYGAGDKFDEALQPIKRYLGAWKRKGYEFRHVNPKEATRRLLLIDSVIAELQAARSDLEKRSVTAVYSAPPERQVK